MVIREADEQLEISGSPGELNAIADAIERMEAGAVLSSGADAAADPRPYKRCLTALVARITEGPVRVALSGDRVVVTGSAAMMRAFASYFRFDAGAPRGTHHHYEWFDGNDYVAPDSAPLVVSVE
jgi:CelD/BcsL family acetyltransferase involved in cellulose biosynthesis